MLGSAVAVMPLELGSPETDEARLIRATRKGEEHAFAVLVRRHQGRVFRLASRFFRLPEDVEDVAQETFLTAWSRLDTYRAEAPFEHWLTRLCLNCCYARLRRAKGRESTFPLLPSDEAAETRDPGIRVEVQSLLRHLAPADRFILVLLDGEGWSTAEIADRLGWTRINVKVRAHRARKKLRRLLEGRPLEEGASP